MRAFLLVAAAAILLILPPSLRAAETADADAIGGLIQRLSSQKFAERERADRALRRIGEPALQQLKEATHSKDPETRERAAVIVRLVEQQIENDKLLRAPKLRLKYENTPLNDAIADLAKKTGLKYALDPKYAKDPKQPLTLDTGEVPYWEAVEKFLAAAALMEIAPAVPAPMPGNMYLEQPRMRSFRGGRAVPLQPDATIRLVEGKAPLSASTATLIRVKALPRETQTTNAPKANSQSVLHLEVTPAPTLGWQGVINVDVRRVVDERGTALVQSHTYSPLPGADNTIWADGMPIQIIQQGQGQIIIQGNVKIWDVDGSAVSPAQANPRHVPVALLARDSSSKVLKELEGVLTAQVLTPPEPILTLDNFMKATTKDMVRKGEYEMEVVERHEDNANYLRLRIRIQIPMRNEFFALRGGVVFQNDIGGGGMIPAQVQVQDAAGKPITGISLQMMEQTFDGMTQTSVYSLSIRKTATEPAKIVAVGRRSATVEVPFALKNVPMP